MSRYKFLLPLAAAAVLFYSPGLLPGRVLLPLDILCWQLPWAATATCGGVTPANPVISDQVLQFYPWHEVMRREGWRGALWNPYAFAGSPMLANGQAAPLYPLTWLHLALPPTWSYVLAAILRTIIAASFTFAFARRKYSPEAAALAAVAYAFSYTFVFAVGYPIGDAITWLPALLWAVAAGRYGWLALFTALDLLAGQPESAAIVAGVVGAWWIAQKPAHTDVAKVAAAVAAGLIIALPALLPFLRYVTLSAASRLRAEYNPMFYSAHTLLDLLTPEFFGTSAPTKSWGSNPGGFFGLLPVLLAPAWIAARWRRAVRDPFFWVFAASLGCIYRIPPLSWLLSLPHLRTVYVSKFWAAVTFAGAMLAAAAFDDYRQRRFLLWWTAAATALCGLCAWWACHDLIVALHLEHFETWVAIKLSVSLAATLAVLRWRPALAPLVLFAEMSLYLFGYNPATPRELLYPSTPAIDFLKRDNSPFRIMGNGVIPASTAGIFGLHDVRGYDAITYDPYFTYMTRVDHSFPDLASRLDLTSDTLFNRDRFIRPLQQWGRGYRDFLHRAYYWNDQLQRVDNPHLLDLLNVKYFLVAHGAHLPPGIEDYPLVYSGEVDIYRNPHALPRAYVDGDASRARIVSDRPTEVVIEAGGPGLLVLADTVYPGWEAEGFAIEPVEGLLRGVRLSAGNHMIRFVFHAWNWK